MKFMVNGAVDVNRAVYRVPLLRWREVVGIGMDMGIYIGRDRDEDQDVEGACRII